jgi:hypothetical protein
MFYAAVTPKSLRLIALSKTGALFFDRRGIPFFYFHNASITSSPEIRASPVPFDNSKKNTIIIHEPEDPDC